MKSYHAGADISPGSPPHFTPSPRGKKSGRIEQSTRLRPQAPGPKPSWQTLDLIDNTQLNAHPVLGGVVDPNPHATMPKRNLPHEPCAPRPPGGGSIRKSNRGHVCLGRVAFCSGLTCETGLGAAAERVLRKEPETIHHFQPLSLMNFWAYSRSREGSGSLRVRHSQRARPRFSGAGNFTYPLYFAARHGPAIRK